MIAQGSGFVPARTHVADDAGALLVRSGLVSASALDDARSRVEQQGGTVGEHLVANRSVDDDALTEFYRQRLLVPQVNPNTLARLPTRVVAAIPADMAVELRAIPVSLDNENNLTVAMSDPSDRHAVDEISFFTGAYVVRAVATQMQIAWCLAHYYGHVTPLGQKLLQPTNDGISPAQAVAAPAPSGSGQIPRTRGHTAKVDATRHRAIAPITGAFQVARPSSKPLDDPKPGVPMPPAQEAPPLEGRTNVSSAGVVEAPRARTASGEIRIPQRRAPSIKPAPEPIYEEDSSPVIVIEAEPGSEEETGPAKKPAPKRRPNVKTDPPELAARAGEVDIATGPVRRVDLEEPRIVIDDDAFTIPPSSPTGEITGQLVADEVRTRLIITEPADEEDSGPVTIHSHVDRPSEPIILDRKRPSDPPKNKALIIEDDEDDEDVVVLDAKKPKKPRPEKRTVMGVGAMAMPAKQTARIARDTVAEDGVPGAIDDAPTGVVDRAEQGDATRLDTPAAPKTGESTDETLAAPPEPVAAQATQPTPVPEPEPDTEDDDEDDDDDGDADNPDAFGRATAVMSAVELDAVIPERKSTTELVEQTSTRRRHDYDSVDDGWGPPGTTIPPPLLGAIPGADDDGAGEVDGATIPIANVDSAPLMVAPPSPPEPARGSVGAEGSGGIALVRELEEQTAQVIELIRQLEHAIDRDEVIAAMIAHLAATHLRAGFFSIKTAQIKGGELGVFKIVPTPAAIPSATLRLDRPSTLADVVGTRLPYRGPMHDELSRTFMTSVLGACPPEILLVPVTVRERVVGVLFGEHRRRHTFDDQLALAARAAGLALERIVKSRRI